MGMRDIERKLAAIERALGDKLECTEVEFKPCDWPEEREKLVARLDKVEKRLKKLEGKKK